MNFKKFEWMNALYLLIITLPVVVLDQATKFWAITLRNGGQVVVFESWWSFIYAENRGALWGIGGNFPDFYRKLIFLGISTVITLFIVYLLFTYAENRLIKVVYGFVLGGALGNLFDRYFRGYVIDFIDWHAGDYYHWPTFNIADAAIVVAVALLLIELLFFQKKKDSK
ncbi:MAG TPA: signal peptidase II [bacterium]|jgi:signal peptidase II|nr:signal peptidase II [bacterium]MDX9806203.1 signal peptidase II [bacterium]HNW15330.1 signal peptidase II [bacterium]HNZ53221.1 signal peptidase II [bacterium]HOB70273.1 signal peptidase II [bacterium]